MLSARHLTPRAQGHPTALRRPAAAKTIFDAVGAPNEAAMPATVRSSSARLAGYEDVNDADRLAHDPAMRWVVGGRAVRDRAATASQMGRFEAEWLASEENLAALANLAGK
jgi:hypothetical protein